MSHITLITLLLGLAIILLCLILTAFFSMTEAAVLSISNLKAKHIQEQQGKKADSLTLWIKHPSYVLVALLICNNLTTIFVSVFADNLAHKIFGRSSIFILSALMTLIIVLFAEVIPKTIAKNFAADIVVPILKAFKIFYWITWPITQLITFMSNTVQKWIFKNYAAIRPPITKEELQFMIHISEKEGVIPEQKYSMLSGVFELSKTPIREIMIPRPDVIGISKNTKIPDVIAKFKETGFSRFPIYDKELDNAIGLVHVKDALFSFINSEDLQNFMQKDVSAIKREVMVIPETLPIDQVFQNMRKQKQQLAIVIDEHGGTAGIVTMEDIFEEIFGEVSDEYDSEEELIHPAQNASQFIVDCKIHLDTFSDYFEIDIKQLRESYPQEFDTLAGLILHHFGRLPRVKEKFSLANLELEILEISKRRVRKVCVTRHS